MAKWTLSARRRLRRISAAVGSSLNDLPLASAGLTLTVATHTAAAAAAAAAAAPQLSQADVLLFQTQGFLVVRNLLPIAALDTICRHVDHHATNFPEWQQRHASKRAMIEETLSGGSPPLTTQETAGTDNLQEITTAGRWARLGERVFPLRSGTGLVSKYLCRVMFARS